MRRGKRREASGLSLSFLDVICCGFGGIILLLVLTKVGEVKALEQSVVGLEGLVVKLQDELHEIRGETDVFDRRLRAKQEQISEERVKVARLQGDLSRIQGEFAASREMSEVSDILDGRLLAAHQELTEEMKRLQELNQQRRRTPDSPIGGIPVDSEYIIFVIDTSGSMFHYAWPLVLKKMSQVLDIYPQVKGIQVMNDMGQYMFSRYAGKWIPDTPARRKAILDRLASWNVFSNSSPVEGISRAIQTFAKGDKKVSLYVFGDEFSGGSIDSVVQTVARINVRDAEGNQRVRIHAIGFPVVFSIAGVDEGTGVRFATLMRILCRENGGTFVGLSSAER